MTAILSSFLLILILSACNPLEAFKRRIGMTHAESTTEVTDEDERSLVDPSPIYILTPLERRRVRKFFLAEIYEHIYARKFRDKEAYIRWMNVLEQGASVEGVYRGLILSREYAQMERGKSTKEALDFFSGELARIAMLKDGKKMATLESKEVKEKISAIKHALLKKFERQPLFTLKRILGEEILEYMDRVKKNREEISVWYSDTAIRWNKYNVGFGIEKRNSADSDFHKKWSRRNSVGRIQWEVLNRMHRLLNSLGKIVYTK